MEYKLNKNRHGQFTSTRNRRGFFSSNQQRKAFFWYLVGDAAAYFIVFYYIGYVLGTVGMAYIFFWPLLKGIFGPLFGL